MHRAGQETEIKLAVESTPAVRRRLRALGFRACGPQQRERNTIWDTDGRLLTRRGCLLRLRVVDGRGWVTFKGPRQRSRGFKVRAECEFQVTPPTNAQKILKRLGYRPVFRYEKVRTAYTHRRERGGEVLLDETPIGTYLELEGNKPWIRRLARRLGYTPGDFITKTYAELYREWCRRRGRRAGDMIFRRRRVSP